MAGEDSEARTVPVSLVTTEYEISHADAIEQFLIEAYGTSMRIYGDDDRHLLRHRRTDVGTLATETAYQSADLGFEVEPLHKLVVTRTSTSRLERASGAAHRRYDAGEIFLMMASPETAAAPLVIASATQLLAAVTLATFPNTPSPTPPSRTGTTPTRPPCGGR